jgi:hypothetical protein
MKPRLSEIPGGAESRGGSLDPAEIIKPAPEEIAGKAYFMYVNEGFPQGRDVQHWLDAEMQLITQSTRTRIHGSHN